MRIETTHTCLTHEGSPVCAGCRTEREAMWELGAQLAQRADWEREAGAGDWSV